MAAARLAAPSVEEAIVLCLFDLANHLAKGGERLARLAGLTVQQWLVLLHIAGDPNFPAAPGPGAGPGRGVLPSAIAEQRGVSRASISATVAALLARGLVRQEGDPGDGRRRRLVATAAGIEALRAVEPARRAANRKLVSGLRSGERRRLLGHLRSCLAALWRDRPAAAGARSRGRT